MIKINNVIMQHVELNKIVGKKINKRQQEDIHFTISSQIMVFSGVRIARSCLFFCTFPFGHCAVCSSSKYGF